MSLLKKLKSSIGSSDSDQNKSKQQQQSKQQQRTDATSLAAERAAPPAIDYDAVVNALDKNYMDPAFDPVAEIMNRIPEDSNDLEMYLNDMKSTQQLKLDAIQVRLSREVSANYGAFVDGMRQLSVIDMDISRASIHVSNSLRKLGSAKGSLVAGTLGITYRRRRRERLGEVLRHAKDIRSILLVREESSRFCRELNYPEAIRVISEGKTKVLDPQMKVFHILSNLESEIETALTETFEYLETALQRQFVSFNPSEYGSILRALALLDKGNFTFRELGSKKSTDDEPLSLSPYSSKENGDDSASGPSEGFGKVADADYLLSGIPGGNELFRAGSTGGPVIEAAPQKRFMDHVPQFLRVAAVSAASTLMKDVVIAIILREMRLKLRFKGQGISDNDLLFPHTNANLPAEFYGSTELAELHTAYMRKASLLRGESLAVLCAKVPPSLTPQLTAHLSSVVFHVLHNYYLCAQWHRHAADPRRDDLSFLHREPVPAATAIGVTETSVSSTNSNLDDAKVAFRRQLASVPAAVSSDSVDGVSSDPLSNLSSNSGSLAEAESFVRLADPLHRGRGALWAAMQQLLTEGLFAAAGPQIHSITKDLFAQVLVLATDAVTLGDSFVSGGFRSEAAADGSDSDSESDSNSDSDSESSSVDKQYTRAVPEASESKESKEEDASGALSVVLATASAPLRGTLRLLCAQYLDALHLHAVNKLQQLLQSETWVPLGIDFEDVEDIRRHLQGVSNTNSSSGTEGAFSRAALAALANANAILASDNLDSNRASDSGTDSKVEDDSTALSQFLQNSASRNSAASFLFSATEQTATLVSKRTYSDYVCPFSAWISRGNPFGQLAFFEGSSTAASPSPSAAVESPSNVVGSLLNVRGDSMVALLGSSKFCMISFTPRAPVPVGRASSAADDDDEDEEDEDEKLPLTKFSSNSSSGISGLPETDQEMVEEVPEAVELGIPFRVARRLLREHSRSLHGPGYFLELGLGRGISLGFQPAVDPFLGRLVLVNNTVQRVLRVLRAGPSMTSPFGSGASENSDNSSNSESDSDSADSAFSDDSERSHSRAGAREDAGGLSVPAKAAAQAQNSLLTDTKFRITSSLLNGFVNAIPRYLDIVTMLPCVAGSAFRLLCSLFELYASSVAVSSLMPVVLQQLSELQPLGVRLPERNLRKYTFLDGAAVHTVAAVGVLAHEQREKRSKSSIGQNQGKAYGKERGGRRRAHLLRSRAQLGKFLGHAPVHYMPPHLILGVADSSSVSSSSSLSHTLPHEPSMEGAGARLDGPVAAAEASFGPVPREVATEYFTLFGEKIFPRGLTGLAQSASQPISHYYLQGTPPGGTHSHPATYLMLARFLQQFVLDSAEHSHSNAFVSSNRSVLCDKDLSQPISSGSHVRLDLPFLNVGSSTGLGKKGIDFSEASQFGIVAVSTAVESLDFALSVLAVARSMFQLDSHLVAHSGAAPALLPPSQGSAVSAVDDEQPSASESELKRGARALSLVETFFSRAVLVSTQLKALAFNSLVPLLLPRLSAIPEYIAAIDWLHIHSAMDCSVYVTSELQPPIQAAGQLLIKLRDSTDGNKLSSSAAVCVWSLAASHALELVLTAYSLLRAFSTQGIGLMSLDAGTLYSLFSHLGPLLPPPHATRDRSFVDLFISALYLSNGKELLDWIKADCAAYPLSVVKNLVENAVSNFQTLQNPQLKHADKEKEKEKRKQEIKELLIQVDALYAH